MARRSISRPIIYGSVSVAVMITMLIAWLIVSFVVPELPGGPWLVALGVISMVWVSTVLIVFIISSVQGVLEVRKQESFIDSVTHELKSPLASLKLCLETLDRPELSSEQSKTLRQMMREDIDRLGEFIDDVLTASRIGHERSPHDMESIPLLTLVSACARRSAASYHVPPETIHISIPEEQTLLSDPQILSTVLRNLLDNALKYGGGAPRIEVRSAQGPKGLTLEVTDQGIGLSSRDRKRAAQRFFRADREEVRKKRGTGLGLYVVTALVKDLGGAFSLHSDGEGQGTTARIIFPEREGA